MPITVRIGEARIVMQMTYTVPEVADALKIGRAETSRLIESGEMTAIKLDPRAAGKHPRYRVSGWELLSFMKRRRTR